jgi:predicted acylesterase/phospholipase RssA
MAGGVTSGIIYPGAVVEIAKRYGFRSIGGTSVGAIAAAVTAAAEYGRRSGSNPHAFSFVSTLPGLLGAKAPDGRSRLFHLFTAEPDTRRLMDLLTAVFGAQGWTAKFLAVGSAAIRSPSVAVPVAAALLLGGWLVVTLTREGRYFMALFGLLAVFAFAAVTLVGAFGTVLWRRWLPAWRRNGYGACTGLTAPHAGQAAWQGFDGLTAWIHASVQAAAGRKSDDAPLTFGDLWGAPALDGSSSGLNLDEVTTLMPRSIELAMIASDISRNRTVQLPFLETPSPLYVERAMLERYFSAPVVTWMAERAGENRRGVEIPPGFFRLPAPQDIPVVFAARLSLSFPILLCAVPLWTPDFAAKRERGKLAPLRKVWFSDGGLTSNFPIHFFDGPLPSHPTFCLNLVDFDTRVDGEGPAPTEGDAVVPARPAVAKPIGEARADARRADRRPDAAAPEELPPGDPVWGFVSMSDGNRAPPVQFTAFDDAGLGLGAFLKTLLNTARFWSDNQLLAAPGFRDRVVHIALREDEGGLNLDMDAKVIADLDRRGRAAGALIAARFDPDAKIDPETGGEVRHAFPNHRWVRFRTFMAGVEDLSRRFAVSRRQSAKAAGVRKEPSLEDMIARRIDTIGYEPVTAARAYYGEATELLDRFAANLAAQTMEDPARTFDAPREPGKAAPRRGAAPRPKMSLRLRPLVDNDPRAEMCEALGSPDDSVPSTARPGGTA